MTHETSRGNGRRACIRAVAACLVALAALVAPAAAQEAQPPAGGAAMDGFVPMSEMTNREVLPAAPLVFYAYGFVWVALLGYLWVIWRRVGQVEKDLAAVRRRLDGQRGGQ